MTKQHGNLLDKSTGVDGTGEQPQKEMWDGGPERILLEYEYNEKA
jgi:hypothetical protein